MMWKVIVDISPRTIEGTNGCHKYVWGHYKTKREAVLMCNDINSPLSNGILGVATFEKEDK